MTCTTTTVESTSLASTPEGVLVTTDAKGRLRVPKEQRKAVLARFEKSGMSAAKFAAVAGIKYSTFAAWPAKAADQLYKVKTCPYELTMGTEHEVVLKGAGFLPL